MMPCLRLSLMQDFGFVVLPYRAGCLTIRSLFFLHEFRRFRRIRRIQEFRHYVRQLLELDRFRDVGIEASFYTFLIYISKDIC